MGKAGTTQKTAHLTLLDAMQDAALFGPWFRGKTWDGWRVFLSALFSLPMGKAALAALPTAHGPHSCSRKPPQRGVVGGG